MSYVIQHDLAQKSLENYMKVHLLGKDKIDSGLKTDAECELKCVFVPVCTHMRTVSPPVIKNTNINTSIRSVLYKS